MCLSPHAKEQAMTTQEFHDSQPSHTPPDRDADVELGVLTVPYVGQTRMRLTITSGLARARVRVDPAATELIAIDCGHGTVPGLRVSASELRVSWPWPTTVGAWLRAGFVGDHRNVEIVLHPEVEWSLQIRGGLSRFEADLTSGNLAQLEISGGVSETRLDLPPPGAVVPIRISGGVSALALRRPASTGVTLAVTGGLCGLDLDDQHFGAIGGGARLTSGRVQGDIPRYAVEISGGARALHIAPRRASLDGEHGLATTPDQALVC
jgi:hypothetical protein